MLIPLILITASKENSKYIKVKYVTFIIGLFFIIFSETTIRLISTNNLLNYLISILPFLSVIFLYITFIIIFKPNRKFL